MESAEAKLLRREAKRAAKEARRQDETHLAGYSNVDNPWNDPNLGDTFCWDKKVQREQVAGSTSQKRSRRELADELVKVKKAREQREKEREEFEVERRELDRQREQMSFTENEKREDEFQLRQEQSRALKRVEEGRARPVDILAASLATLQPADDDAPAQGMPCEVLDPLLVLDEASERELRELQADSSRMGELDGANVPFWDAMAFVCEDLLQGPEAALSAMQLHVRQEIDSMLKEKSKLELDELEGQIEEQRRQDTNTDYWEAVLARLKLTRARRILQDTHAEMLRRRLELSHATQPGRDAPMEATGRGGGGGGEAPVKPVLEEGADEDYEEELESVSQNAVVSAPSPPPDGRYSPVLLATIPDGHASVDAAEDDVLVAEARRSARTPSQTAVGAEGGADPLVEAEARKGMGSGEARFSFEVPLEDKVEWWHDKYRPRKPKYFNRVHTGYEWNKYNQTHFDHDNPPPKMVQGYKFNVFYPDLVDRVKTPTYSLLPDPGGATDTCLLRFHGGAPYEDCAFKIVNQEWETSHKRGFRCRFERGILQLYFNFKRHRYRR